MLLEQCYLREHANARIVKDEAIVRTLSISYCWTPYGVAKLHRVKRLLS
jgi:hypothetical protein